MDPREPAPASPGAGSCAFLRGEPAWPVGPRVSARMFSRSSVARRYSAFASCSFNICSLMTTAAEQISACNSSSLTWSFSATCPTGTTATCRLSPSNQATLSQESAPNRLFPDDGVPYSSRLQLGTDRIAALVRITLHWPVGDLQRHVLELSGPVRETLPQRFDRRVDHPLLERLLNARNQDTVHGLRNSLAAFGSV